QAEDEQRQHHTEADLVLARPASHVVDVEFPQRHLLLAHWAAPSAGAAGSAFTGGTGSGMPSPSSSVGALGLASWTDRLNMYGSPATPSRASMIDRSGLVIQPEPSRLRM